MNRKTKIALATNNEWRLHAFKYAKKHPYDKTKYSSECYVGYMRNEFIFQKMQARRAAKAMYIKTLFGIKTINWV